MASGEKAVTLSALDLYNTFTDVVILEEQKRLLNDQANQEFK